MAEMQSLYNQQQELMRV